MIIDDKSLDDTIKKEMVSNTKICTSTKPGKGASMRDGMLLSINEIIVYLVADNPAYPEDIIEILADPIRGI